MAELAAAVQAAASDGLAVHQAVSTRRCKRFLDIDREAGWVRVESGLTLRALHARLAAWGLALEDPGQRDTLSVGAAISSGAHGSGARSPSLAAQVLDLDLIGTDGSIRHCSATESPDVFAAARASLGALGVVARVTLRAVPAFNVASTESVEDLDDLDLDAEIARYDHFAGAWHPHTRKVTVRRRARTTAPPGGLGRLGWSGTYGAESLALLARSYLGGSSLGGSSLGGIRRPGTGRRGSGLVAPGVRLALGAQPRRAYTDRSYRVLSTPHWGRFAESEWALPRPALRDALHQLVAWHEAQLAARRAPVVPFPVEVGTGASDDVWLSGAYGRDTGYLSARAVVGGDPGEWFAAVAAIMGPLGGRPGLGTVVPWGAPDLAPCYPRWADWHALRRRLDPEGRFATAESDRLLGPVR